MRLKLYTLLNRTLLQIQNIDPYSLNLIKLYFQYRIVTEWIQTHSFFRKKNNLKSCHNALVINLIRAFHPIFTFSKQGAGSMSTLWQPARGSHGNNSMNITRNQALCTFFYVEYTEENVQEVQEAERFWRIRNLLC